MNTNHGGLEQPRKRRPDSIPRFALLSDGGVCPWIQVRREEHPQHFFFRITTDFRHV